MINATFTNSALSQFEYWIENNPRIASKILKLIRESAKTPFSGTGHPEKLKYELNEFWSRRINDEHRLVYKIENESIIIVS